MTAGLLDLAATWTPDSFAALMSQAMEVAALEGREAVFADGEDDPSFAEPDFTRQEFREQIDFLTQKRGKPTKSWLDAQHGDHDRSFVVAGVTNMAMLEEFQQAVIEAARTYDVQAFAGEFDRLVEKYGWSYNGGREWRIRTIVETNIRTSYMAGRLRQMRDPDMVKLRPFWQYIHADTRVPMNPRPQHQAWDGMILRWDDPWWDIYFPPNDWLCSCGCRTLSRGDLRRLGKSGPDTAPEIVREPVTDRRTGETFMLPPGVGRGWDYMPGDLWERGLVPSELEPAAPDVDPPFPRHIVTVDTPSPIEDLRDQARPFAADLLDTGLSEEDYVKAFLTPFGADIGKAALFIDKIGTRIPISDQMFIDHFGRLKATKRGREIYMARLAETIIDPDEIWIGVTGKRSHINREAWDLIMDRRYIRIDGETGLVSIFQMGRRWWEETTAYPTTDDKGRPDQSVLDNRRGGKLIWSRFGKK